MPDDLPPWANGAHPAYHDQSVLPPIEALTSDDPILKDLALKTLERRLFSAYENTYGFGSGNFGQPAMPRTEFRKAWLAKNYGDKAALIQAAR